MVAGVLLGPSLLGWLAPSVSAYLFPKASMPVLFSAAQVALVLYMFTVGMDFDLGLLRSRTRSAVFVSGAGIAVPFALGALIARGLLARGEGGLFGAGIAPLQGVLFMGAAMSITAFPVLARIIQEQGIAKTALGTLVLAAGSMDDAAAWCLLAIVLSAFGGSASLALLAVGGGLLFALAMLGPGRRLLAPLGPRAERDGSVSAGTFTRVLVLVMLAAFLTDAIRIYAVFGAFLTGAAMPRGRFVEDLKRRIEPLTVGFLLPLFFVYSGLNTRIGLLTSPSLILLTLVVVLAACAGKGIACWAAARVSGESGRDALATGILMNARGLMELIILNIGLERGIITPTLFTMMVLMALATTLMATPLFRLVYRRAPAPENAAEARA
jgi:Kef-type K+ transport system membrane component KefB